MSDYYPPGGLFHSPSMASSFIGYVSRDDASEVDPDRAWEALRQEHRLPVAQHHHRASVASTADTEDYSVASTFDNFTETEGEDEGPTPRSSSRSLFRRLRERAASVGQRDVKGDGPGRRGSAIVASFPAPPTPIDIEAPSKPIIDPAITRFSRSDLNFDMHAFALANDDAGFASSASSATIVAPAAAKTHAASTRTIAADLRKSISFPSGYAALASIAASVPAHASQGQLPTRPADDSHDESEASGDDDDDDAASVYSHDSARPSRSSARMSREWQTARARVRARASVSLSMLVAQGTSSPSMANLRSLMDEELPTAL
jgi:hypothetical protein